MFLHPSSSWCCSSSPFVSIHSANTQVRGSGTWAGNLTLVAKNNTFASDIALVFTALEVQLEVMDCAHKSQSTTRRVSVEEWLSSAPSSKQVLVRGHFPSLLLIPDHSTHMWYSDKTAQRHVNSHPIASVACLLVLNHQQVFPNWRKTLEGCVIAPGSSVVVGGLFSPAIRRCRELETAMQGSRIDRDLTLQKGLAALDGLVEAARKSGVGLSEDRQNTTSYRVALVRTFLYKTFLTANKHRLPHDLKSAAEPFAAAEDRPVSRGHQLFLVPEEESGQLPVGLAVPKLTARLQASGEAKYPSDNVGGKLWGAFVLSTKSHATLLAIDSSKAAAMPGFAGIVTSDDVAGVNAIDVRAKVFIPIGSPCPYIGAPVAVVVADSNKRARAAAKAVMLTFGNDAGDPADDEGFFGTEGASIDVGAARADFDKNSPLASRLRLRSRNKNSSDGVSVMRGDPDSVLGAAAAVQGGGEGMQSVRGRTSMCGQRHFHLETHTTQAAPDEDRRIVLTSGAQFPQYTQAMVAKVDEAVTVSLWLFFHFFFSPFSSSSSSSLLISNFRFFHFLCIVSK
jgi:CO/xanthine dehydrogenase FAD-binding subunit